MEVSNDLTNGVLVQHALEYGPTSSHNMSQVAEESVRQFFVVQLRDRFGNLIDDGAASSTMLSVSITGTASPCLDSGRQPSVAIPAVVSRSTPYTGSSYTVQYDPTVAGSYLVSMDLVTQGGLLGTYYRTSQLTSPVLASHDNLFTPYYHEPYWCDGAQPGLYSPLWSFGILDYCDPTIPSCGCDSTRLDAAINFTFGLQSPLPYEGLYSGSFPNEYYSAIWKGYLTSPQSGVYTIQLHSDYSGSITINGTEYVKAVPFGSSSVSFSVSLQQGLLYPLQVSYIHQTDASFFSMSWSGPGISPNSIIGSEYLFYDRSISNSPITLEIYPGPVTSEFSTASGSSLISCVALSTCTFDIQARDASGNNVFNSGSELWNVTIRGIGDWAGYNNSFRRIDDVNYTSVAHVPVSLAPQGWIYVGMGSAVFGSKFVTIQGNTSNTVFRGDSIVVGQEVLLVDASAPYSSTATLSIIPLSRPYLGANISNAIVHKVINCTTGTYSASYSPSIRGLYSISVKTPSVDEVQLVQFKSSGLLNGSYTLTVSATSLGVSQTQTTAPLFLGSKQSSGAAVQSALNALTNLNSVSVNYSNCAVASSSCSFVITFFGLDQNIPLIGIDAAAVTGNAMNYSVSELVMGQPAIDIAGSPYTVQVLPNVTSAAFSTAYGPGLISGFTGVAATFSIQSKDAYGNNRLDSQTLDTYLVHGFIASEPFGSTESSVDGIVTYISGGAYNATYTPFKSGVYTIATLLSTQLEVQNITVSYSTISSRAGYFVLSYGFCTDLSSCNTTGRLGFDVSPDALQAAIEALPGAGPVAVSYSQTSDYLDAAWTVTFLEPCDKLPLSIVETTLSVNTTTVAEGACSHIYTSNTSMGFPYVNTYLVEEVQQLSVNFSACGNQLSACSFSISYRGYSTIPLLYNATASAVKSALESLASIGSVNVNGSQGATTTVFVVTFDPTAGSSLAHIESYGNLPDFTLTSNFIPASGLAVIELVRGYSPFAASIVAVNITAAACTAVDSPGVAGLNGLSTGIYLDSTSFQVESRDAFGNRVFLGPVNDVQIIEVYSNSSYGLLGSFGLFFQGYSAQIAAKTSLDDFQGILEQNLLVGAITVSTSAVTTPTSVVASAILGSFTITASADPSLFYSVGDWIRIADSNSGPVFAVTAIDPITRVITLNKPYYGQTSSNLPVFYQPNSSFQYIITFDSILGDVPGLAIDTSTLTTADGATTFGSVTSCEKYMMQLIQTSAAGPLNGTFYLQLGSSTSTHLPYNASATAVQAAIQSFDGIYKVQVSRSVGQNSFIWVVSFISYDETLFPAPLYAEGYLLQGLHSSAVAVNYCPYSPGVAGPPVQSVLGVIGETFYAEVDGPMTVKAVVNYAGNGVFDLSYISPREGLYNLSVYKAANGGLVGVYFNNRWLFGEPAFSRVDSFLDFYWSANDTITPTGRDYISIRWSGYILPAFSEVYTFIVTVDDGARLWIDDVLLLDEFNNTVPDGSAPSVFTAVTPFPLVASQLSSIKIEYRENTGAAAFVLGWSSPSQPYAVVPPYRLYPYLQQIKGSPFTVSPTSRKPTAVTNLTLSIASWDAIEVQFAAPSDDGGSDIIAYGVEWFNAHGSYGTQGQVTIKLSKLVDGGSFTLIYNGIVYWYPIAFDATSTDIMTALESLPGIGSVDVHDGSDASSYYWRVTFLSNLAAGQGNPYNSGLSTLGIDASGLQSSQSSASPLALICQNGTQIISATIICLVSDSVVATAALVNGSYSGSPLYPAVVSLNVEPQSPYTYVVGNLIQSSAYTEGFSFRVYAVNSAGIVSLPSPTVSLKPMGLPDVPTYVEAINVSGADDAVNVYWSSVNFPEDRASPVLSYQVQWATNSTFAAKGSYTGLAGQFASTRIPLGSQAILQYMITGLIPGSNYYIRVCSINLVGMSC